MRAPGPVPDANEIFTILQERASGLSPSEIGLRHKLSAAVIQQFLRPRGNTTLPTPFELSQHTGDGLAVPLYWLGFIAACGRASHLAPGHPLVLSVDEDDLEHVRKLVEDLLRTRTTYEHCLSSHEGHQAYIRERDLGEAATHWGVTTSPRETALPVDHIPAAALPHFVRGLIEGQVHEPPFGGRKPVRHHPSPRVRELAIAGSPRFTEALRRRLLSASRALEGVVEPTDSPARSILTFRRAAAEALLRFAYREPVRSSPRADKFVRAFGPSST